MNSIAPQDIDSDLVQWSRTRWVGAVLLILAVQGLLLLKAPSSIVPASREPNQRTLVRFARVGGANDLIQVQDPTLFAGANRRGFSGAAWMIRAPWRAPVEPGLPRPEFLAFHEAAPLVKDPSFEPPPALGPVTHARPEAQPSVVMMPEQYRVPRAESRLTAQGLLGRRLASAPPPPVQYATDALRPSVVQVLVDTEGSVFSARLLSSSGSKLADGDALRLARKAQFEPAAKPGELEPVTTGKLVFEWYALDPSQTNSVKR